jgi:hypothetical protein
LERPTKGDSLSQGNGADVVQLTAKARN